MRRYLFLSMGLAFVLAAIFFQTAHAASACDIARNYAGRLVQSCKENYTVPGNVYWKGRMISQVHSGGAISQLGWNSWTDTRFCGDVPQYVVDYGASYGNNSTLHASTSADHPIGTCGGGGQNWARVFGIHRWEQVGFPPLIETGWYLPRNLP